MSFDNSLAHKASNAPKQNFQDCSYQLNRNEDQKQQLLTQINGILAQKRLVRHDYIRIKHWLQKLSLRAHNIVWGQNRNFYLRALKQMLIAQKIIEPFSAIPPEGPLPRLTLFDIPYPIRDRLHKVYSCAYDDQNWNSSNMQTKRLTSRSKSSLRSSYKVDKNLKSSVKKRYSKEKSLLNSVNYAKENQTSVQRAYQNLNLVASVKNQTKKNGSNSKFQSTSSKQKQKWDSQINKPKRKLTYDEQVFQKGIIDNWRQLQLTDTLARSETIADNTNLHKSSFQCKYATIRPQQQLENLFKHDRKVEESQRVPANIKKIKKNRAQQTENVKKRNTILDFCSNAQPARSRSKSRSVTPDKKYKKNNNSKSPLTCVTDLTQNYGYIDESQKVQKSLEVMKNSLLFLGQYYEQFKNHKEYKQLIQNIVKAASQCGQNFLQLTLDPISYTSNQSSRISFGTEGEFSHIDSGQKSRISLIFQDQQEQLRNDFKEYSKQIKEKFNQTGTQAAQFMQYLQTVRLKERTLKEKFLKRSIIQPF